MHASQFKFLKKWLLYKEWEKSILEIESDLTVGKPWEGREERIIKTNEYKCSVFIFISHQPFC